MYISLTMDVYVVFLCLSDGVDFGWDEIVGLWVILCCVVFCRFVFVLYLNLLISLWAFLYSIMFVLCVLIINFYIWFRNYIL